MALRGTAKDASAHVTILKAEESTKTGVASANTGGQAAFRKVLEEAVYTITEPEGAGARSARAAALAGYATAEAHVAALYIACRVLQTATRLNLESPEVIASVVASGLQDALARDLSAAVSLRREALRAAMAATVPSAPTLDSMRWRVDVTISSSSLSKVLRPSLILEMTLSDGNIHTFEASVDTFHELRHTVAKLLVDMGGVESNPVLKIN